MYRIYTHPSKWWWWFTSPKSGHSTRFVGPKRIQITFYRRLLNHQTRRSRRRPRCCCCRCRWNWLITSKVSIHPSIYPFLTAAADKHVPTNSNPFEWGRQSVSQPAQATQYKDAMTSCVESEVPTEHMKNSPARERWHNTSPVCTSTKIQSSSPQKMIVIMYIHTPESYLPSRYPSRVLLLLLLPRLLHFQFHHGKTQRRIYYSPRRREWGTEEAQTQPIRSFYCSLEICIQSLSQPPPRMSTFTHMSHESTRRESHHPLSLSLSLCV